LFIIRINYSDLVLDLTKARSEFQLELAFSRGISQLKLELRTLADSLI
jgi:hypothetical protein